MINGVPSIILSGNIKGDGSIIVTNSKSNKKSINSLKTGKL